VKGDSIPQEPLQRKRSSKHSQWRRTVSEVVREHPTLVQDGDTTYVVRICARENTNGKWQGWLEFYCTDKTKSVLRTGQETSQPSRFAIEYWAYGLEPVYLEGALARAQGRFLQPSILALPGYYEPVAGRL
jgi:hypothetical protein